MGNPLNYLGGMSFSWDRGRQLKDITFENGEKVSYNYNENGLRTYKDTKDATTTYEWDETTLIRETVTYKATGKKYDVWYFYDTEGNAAGFEYSQLNDMGSSLTKTRIYYEKNLQGDVIGLLDSRGIEIATYAYDAWGNVTGTLCYEGNEIPYALNHITYRGYYQDDETGFYYLQSRYYDAEVGRFVNADDVEYLDVTESTVSKDNLYVYCNGNPVSNTDPDGRKPKISSPISNLSIKNIIYTAGYAYLSQKKYTLARKMFYHALYGGGKKLPKDTQKLLNNKIKTNLKLHIAIFNKLSKCKKSKTRFSIQYEFTNDKDLFYSVQHATITVDAKKGKNKVWSAKISATDIYDFTELRKWSSLAGIANNIGYYLQSNGDLKPYRWKSEFSGTYKG